MSMRTIFRAALGCAALAVLGCSGESPTGLNQSPIDSPAATARQGQFTPGARVPAGQALRVRVERDDDGPDADDASPGGDANGARRRFSGYLVVAGRR
jgi:hypothetical protein